MKTRELISRYYPLHFQRICEEIHRQITAGYCLFTLDDVLDGPLTPLDGVLQNLFVWERTEEGRAYWEALSQQEMRP